MRARSVRPALSVLVTVTLVAAAATGPGSAEVIPVPASGVWTVQGHGNGHGHGLSQYGARGAAIAGLSAARIVSFYYPGTTLTTLPSSTIAVQLTNSGPTTTVAVAPGQSVVYRIPEGSLTVSSTQATQVRLIASSVAGMMQGQYFHTAWTNWGPPVAAASFAPATGLLRLINDDASSNDYRGSIGAVRQGSGLITVNRLALDDYVKGVVPREMPASWQTQAVQAQAIAARSYARYEIENNSGGAVNICDTTNCQVYGGVEHYSSAGVPQYGEDIRSTAAVAATANQVLTYGGSTIFAQFSASDGGYTFSGGRPYLPTIADPYDNAASGDPWLNWTQTVSVADVAAYFGLAHVSELDITARDYHGQWGGRVLAALVEGVDSRGVTQTIPATGPQLQSAMGLPSYWFDVSGIVPGAPTALSVSAADSALLVHWSPPAAAAGSPITGYLLSAPGYANVSAGPSARSAWFGGLTNGVAVTVTVRAVNAAGPGAPATVSATAVPAPAQMLATSAVRLFDTGATHTLVDPSHPYSLGVPGHGTIPLQGVTAVQLAITVVASTSGVLRVYNHGSPPGVQRSIAYRANTPITSLVTIALVTSAAVDFSPTAGSVRIIADEQGISVAAGSALTPMAPQLMANMPSVLAGSGRLLSVAGRPGVPASATSVLLSVAAFTSGVGGYLRFWADGAAIPPVSQVSVATVGGGGANVVVVRLGPGQAFRVASSGLQIGAALSVVGYLAPAASASSGRLESIPPIRRGPVNIAPGVATNVAVAGAGVPATATAVLAQVSILGSAAGGVMSMWPAGGSAPLVRTTNFPAGVLSTSTVLLPLGAGGAWTALSTGSTISLEIDVLGYTTNS